MSFAILQQIKEVTITFFEYIFVKYEDLYGRYFVNIYSKYG